MGNITYTTLQLQKILDDSKRLNEFILSDVEGVSEININDNNGGISKIEGTSTGLKITFVDDTVKEFLFSDDGNIDIATGKNYKINGTQIATSNLLDGADLVKGPSSATNHAIPTFDGTTGKLIKNSSITIPSANTIQQVGSHTVLDINPNLDIRFGRGTNNAGFRTVIHKGDGSADASHIFRGVGNSYMSVNEGDRLGIGTTSPTARLTIQADGAEVLEKFLTVKNTSGADRWFLGYGGTSTNLSIGSDQNENILTLMRTTGNVGIGILTPTEKLHVVGNVLATGHFNGLTIVKGATGAYLLNSELATDPSNAALRQTDSGIVVLNSPHGYGIISRIGGVVGSGTNLTNSGLRIGAEGAAAEKLDVVGNAKVSLDVASKTKTIDDAVRMEYDSVNESLKFNFL